MSNAVKASLLGLLGSRDPLVLAWRKKVSGALEALGAGEAARSEIKRVDRLIRSER